MTHSDNHDAPLSESLMASLRDDLGAPASLEARTVTALRRDGQLGGTRQTWLRRALPHAIAATVMFAVGVTYARWQDGRIGGSSSERIERTAEAYHSALASASTTDEKAQAAASESFKTTSLRMFQQFPDDPLGLVLNLALNRVSMTSTSTQERSGN